MGKTLSTSKSMAKAYNEQQNDPYYQMSKKLKSFVSGQKQEATDYQTATEQELGLPTLRETAQGLNNQLISQEKGISGMPDIVKGQSRGFDVNQGQLALLTNEKLAPLQKQYGETATEAGRVGQNLASTENVMSQRMGYLNDRLARELTGYTNAFQTELDGIVAKITRKQTLDDAETNRLATLALNEQTFQNRLKEIEAQSSANIREKNATKDPTQDPLAVLRAIQGMQQPTTATTTAAPQAPVAKKSLLDSLWNFGASVKKFLVG